MIGSLFIVKGVTGRRDLAFWNPSLGSIYLYCDPKKWIKTLTSTQSISKKAVHFFSCVTRKFYINAKKERSCLFEFSWQLLLTVFTTISFQWLSMNLKSSHQLQSVDGLAWLSYLLVFVSNSCCAPPVWVDHCSLFGCRAQSKSLQSFQQKTAFTGE